MLELALVLELGGLALDTSKSLLHAAVGDERLGRGRDTVGRVELVLPPCGVSDGTREEGLHALDGDTFGLGDPNEHHDAGTSAEPDGEGGGRHTE